MRKKNNQRPNTYTNLQHFIQPPCRSSHKSNRDTFLDNFNFQLYMQVQCLTSPARAFRSLQHFNLIQQLFDSVWRLLQVLFKCEHTNMIKSNEFKVLVSEWGGREPLAYFSDFLPLHHVCLFPLWILRLDSLALCSFLLFSPLLY